MMQNQFEAMDIILSLRGPWFNTPSEICERGSILHRRSHPGQIVQAKEGAGTKSILSLCAPLL